MQTQHSVFVDRIGRKSVKAAARHQTQDWKRAGKNLEGREEETVAWWVVGWLRRQEQVQTVCVEENHTWLYGWFTFRLRAAFGLLTKAFSQADLEFNDALDAQDKQR